MRIIDTVVLIAFVNQDDSLHEKASKYILDISNGHDVLVPSAALLEFDLELETHGVGDADREKVHSRLGWLIPEKTVLPLTPAVLGRAAQLARKARWRGAYFDTMIVATGLEYGAVSALTTDHRFPKLGLSVTF